MRTFVPAGGRVLVPATGAYADRAIRLAREVGLQPSPLPVPRASGPTRRRCVRRCEPTRPSAMPCLVYSETGTGMIHDVPALAAAAGGRAPGDRRRGLRLRRAAARLCALPMVDAVVFTSNKCLEALPGLAFAVARIDRLLGLPGQRRQLVVRPGRHLPARAARRLGQFPLHAAGAGDGRACGRRWTCSTPRAARARLARYTANMRVLYDGVQRLGLRPYLPPALQGPIVVNVHAPDHPAWNLQGFVDALKARGFLISNFYNTPCPSFRVGCIGAITPEDMPAPWRRWARRWPKSASPRRRPPDAQRHRDRRRRRAPPDRRHRRRARHPGGRAGTLRPHKAKIALDFIAGWSAARTARWCWSPASARPRPARARPPPRSAWATRCAASAAGRRSACGSPRSAPASA